MSKFFLEEPSLEREKDVLDYINEHKKYASNVDGTVFFVCLLTGDTYYDCLVKENNLSDEMFAKENRLIPSKTYFFTRKTDNRITGMINIRFNLSKEDEIYGNIELGIRPSMRGRGYGNILLYLGLEKALNEFNLDKVLVSFDKENKDILKTITNLSGVYLKGVFDKSRNKMVNIYEIDTKKSLEDNYEKYGKD